MRLHMTDRVRPSESDRLWAIATLREEAEFLQRHVQRTDAPLAEDYGTYSVDLALFVARLRDVRAVESLALVSDIAPAVPSALAEFGDVAVDPVLRALEVPFLRRGAAYTLAKLLQSGRLSAENAKKIGRALRR